MGKRKPDIVCSNCEDKIIGKASNSKYCKTCEKVKNMFQRCSSIELRRLKRDAAKRRFFEGEL